MVKHFIYDIIWNTLDRGFKQLLKHTESVKLSNKLRKSLVLGVEKSNKSKPKIRW